MLIQDQTNSICIRCGKVRIFSKKWKDKENGKGSLITYEETVCPDAQCQKLVDEKFQEMKDRRILAQDRKKGIILARTPKTKTAIRFQS